MKRLYNVNKFLIITTIILYFTFWGGIMAQIVLGAIQIIMSISIMIHFNKQSKHVKILFIIYVFTTITTIMLFKTLGQNGDGGLGLMFYFMVITMFLAMFHLFITYKIMQS